MKRSEVLKQVQIHGSEDAVVAAALEIVRNRLVKLGDAMSSPQVVRDYLALNLRPLGHEVFWVIFLDAHNRVLAAEEMFRGTLTQTSVFPREVVKRAMQVNAAAAIFAHNHPSGIAEPSRPDESLTQALKHTLALVDVKVLDHFIVGADSILSFAERGLL
jgi:DNA repair protein RadC